MDQMLQHLFGVDEVEAHVFDLRIRDHLDAQ